MTLPTPGRAYTQGTGTVEITQFVRSDRDPTSFDAKYPQFQGWVNTTTHSLWYLKSYLTTGGVASAEWKAVELIETMTRNPTSSDYLYPLGQTWVNTSSGSYWVLTAISGTTATWVQITGGAGNGIDSITGNTGGAVFGDASNNVNLTGSSGVQVTGSPGTNTLTITLTGGGIAVDSINVDTSTPPGTDPVVPTSLGLITVTGGQTAASTTANVIQTNSLAANSLTIEVQRSQAVASTTVGDNGVCHFNSNHFSVDSNAFVSLVGGGTAADSFQVDAFTAPGTNPVAATTPGGLVTVTGGQTAAGTTANVIQTNSLAANTYTIQVQRSQAVASTTVGDNGVCHFNSNHFSVDSNAFVSLVGGGTATDSFQVDTFTGPGTNPVVPNGSGLVTVTGGQVAAGTTVNVIQTDSLAANTYTVQVQRSQAVATPTVGDNGVSHFNSSHFTVDANGFVSLIGSGGGVSVVNVQVFTTSGTYTPTAGMAYAWVQMVGGGGGGGGASVDGGDTATVGSGGGGGMYASKVYSSATIGVSQTVTIGAGGSGGVGQANGTAGGSTSFGSLITVAGGNAGLYQAAPPAAQEGGDGGSAITGTADYSVNGGGGGVAVNTTFSGFGGSSILSPGGKGRTVAADGIPGGGYGGGGSGAFATAGIPGTGGDGDTGAIIITEYIV